MKDVSNKQYLTRRGEVWHYHRRVPVHLVKIVGKTFIKKSLNVADLKSAMRLRNAYTIQVDAMFAKAEEQLAQLQDGKQMPSEASLGELTEYLRQHLSGLDDRAVAQLLSEPPDDEDQRKQMKMETEIAMQTLKNRDDPNGAVWIESIRDTVTKAQDVALQDRQLIVEFSELVRRGLIELQTLQRDRLDHKYDRAFHDPLFDPRQKTKLTFGEVIKRFWAEREEEYTLNSVSKKRYDKVQAELSFLLDAIGSDTPLSNITDDTVQEVRSLLSRLPANRKKIYPNLSVTEAVERAAKDGQRVLDPVTQAQYLRTLKDVLAVAVRKGLMGHNPAAGVKPLKKSDMSAVEKRFPWTDQQIVDFFTGSFYQSCRVDAAKSYKSEDRAWRFWVPLLMLFTGARPNEICQLYVEDVKQTEQGTWYLDLAEKADRNDHSLKTASSRRRVPLHPQLIKLGFSNLVKVSPSKSLKKAKQIFTTLKPDQYGNYATYATKRFRDKFIAEEITLNDRQALYSLRHNVRDALRTVGAPPETLLAVTGWSPAGRAASDNYGYLAA
ncbi:site-specific integrase [Roseobacter sp. CCS2]|uniref:site-specific integrase n=1 Tax=Roseobacter sp. CCS2 TaxID=391593 RepID=UPI0000F3E4DC|nr:site-specific integrase [Roseobacter sp. CCS2]EBA12236.1 putative integrase/resolvase recombinase protein phage-related integrase [Roseobacter sp. CCS2]